MPTVNKKFSIPGGLCWLAGILVLLASCNNPVPAGDVLVPNPKDTSAFGKIDHFIPQEKIEGLKGEFKSVRDSLRIKEANLLVPESEAFNKRSLLSLLVNPEVVGLKIYHGVKKTEKGQELRLIIVGVDREGKDVLIDQGSIMAARLTQSSGGLEYGQCPPCDPKH